MSVRGHGYPAFNLEMAIKRVKKIYEEEPYNEMTFDAAAKNMGYGGRNGTSIKAISTLRRYGLLEGRGDRIKVSRDAVTILADEGLEDQSERSAALLRCLETDSLFSEIREKFRGVPAENTLLSFLVKQEFKQTAARKIVSAYRESVEYVNRETAHTAQHHAAEKDEGTYAAPTQAAAHQDLQKQSPKQFTFPISENESATLIANFSLTAPKWKRFDGNDEIGRVLVSRRRARR